MGASIQMAGQLVPANVLSPIKEFIKMQEMNAVAKRPTKLIIAANIKRFRKKSGMTQKELGELIGVTPQRICQYERAESEFLSSTTDQIAEALNIDSEMLQKAVEKSEISG